MCFNEWKINETATCNVGDVCKLVEKKYPNGDGNYFDAVVLIYFKSLFFSTIVI
jgi:hypothetical protein